MDNGLAAADVYYHILLRVLLRAHEVHRRLTCVKEAQRCKPASDLANEEKDSSNLHV